MNQTKKTKRTRRRGAQPTAADQTVVPYLKVRDRFLEAVDTTDEIVWLVGVGRFVQDRWLAEEACRSEGQELDENEVWHVWDQCTEKHLRDLRAEAGIALKDYARQRWGVWFQHWATETFKPMKALVVAATWIFWQLLRGVVSGIALILLGLILVALAPDVVQRARGAADAMLPESTQPN